MSLVAKAIWFVESHFTDKMSLDEIAGVAGVSRYHLSRTFSLSTGQSVMGYVRGRRLSQGARRLAGGAADILAVAMDCGYGSHEAFSRAFRDQFGLTPETVRAQAHVDNLALVEALNVKQIDHVRLDPPRFESAKPQLIAGLSEHLNCADRGAIPALWQRFVPHIGSLPGQIGHVAYGVIFNGDDAGNMDYMAGVEVSDFANLSAGMSRLRVPQQTYVVFHHPGHVSAVRSTCVAILNDWLPKSGREAADGPILERYDEHFDSRTGSGGMEIWVPIKT
jgi:AraC family transcriptional regulator